MVEFPPTRCIIDGDMVHHTVIIVLVKRRPSFMHSETALWHTTLGRI
jgi:hypothetical protein